MEFKHPYFTEEEKKEYLKDVLDFLKKGYSISAIQTELGVSRYYIAKMKDVLIANGEITKEMIKNNRKKFAESRRESRKQEKEYMNFKFEQLKNAKNQMLDMVKNGEREYIIRKKLELTPEDFHKLKKEVDSLVTPEQRKQAVELRKIKELQFVTEQMIKGYSLAKIRLMKPEISSKDLYEYGKIAKELGVSKIREKAELEQKEYIEKCLKAGLRISEIDKRKISETKAYELVNQCFDDGVISKKQYYENLQRKKQIENAKEAKKIKQYLKEGYNYSEISKFMGIGRWDIYNLKTEYIKRGNEWYSEEEITKFRHDRKREERIKFLKTQVKDDRINKTKNKGKCYFSKKNFLKEIVEEKNYEFQKDDLDLIFKILMESPGLVNKENLKLLIMKNIELNGIDETKDIISKLKGRLDKTPYKERMEKYEQLLEEKKTGIAKTGREAKNRANVFEDFDDGEKI